MRAPPHGGPPRQAPGDGGYSHDPSPGQLRVSLSPVLASSPLDASAQQQKYLVFSCAAPNAVGHCLGLMKPRILDQAGLHFLIRSLRVALSVIGSFTIADISQMPRRLSTPDRSATIFLIGTLACPSQPAPPSTAGTSSVGARPGSAPPIGIRVALLFNDLAMLALEKRAETTAEA